MDPVYNCEDASEVSENIYKGEMGTWMAKQIDKSIEMNDLRAYIMACAQPKILSHTKTIEKEREPETCDKRKEVDKKGQQEGLHKRQKEVMF